jgi:cyclopropane-fatty-acyl-phospholipid synthase
MNVERSNRGRRVVAPRGHRARAIDTLLSPFAALFHGFLDRMDGAIVDGAIEASLPDGTTRLLGGRRPGPQPVVHLHSWRALVSLAAGGSAGWYEAWARGDWSSPDPVPLFEIFTLNRTTLALLGRASPATRVFRRLAHRLRRNDKKGSRRNIAYHYDLGNDFYRAWLDPTLTYSSALFGAPGAHPEPVEAGMAEAPLDRLRVSAQGRPTAGGLEAAQQAKLDAILARTATGPGDTILEIGCGWGSFAETAARGGRRVHALTLAAEQKRHVEARMAAAGLTGVAVELTDYRDVLGTYDAVASIEMVEAVGQEYWPAYLQTIARVLKPGGRAAIQYIAIDDAIFANYAANVDFIQTYVFPGGLLISESRFRRIAEDCGLEWADLHRFGADYAETLRLWREAFDAADREGRIPVAFDNAFRELWRYYLMYCEGGFRGGAIDVAQVTLVKKG